MNNRSTAPDHATDPGGPAPLVTVVVTVFERTAFLAGALRSVLAQDMIDGTADREVIVADDSNSAAIRDIVAGIGDSRIRYSPSPSRKGLARNIADSLREARGTFVAILNDDDLWEPDFLRALLAPLQADPGCVLAFSDHWIIDADGTVDPDRTEENSRHWGRSALPEGPVAEPGRVAVLHKAVPMVMGALFRRAALDPGDIVPAVGGACDYWLAVLLAASGGTLRYVPRRLTRYRFHPAMETVRPDPAKRDDELFIVGQVIARGWFKNIERELRARHASLCGIVAINKLRFRQAGTARSVAWAGLRSSPDARCLAALALSFSPVLPRRLLFRQGKATDGS